MTLGITKKKFLVWLLCGALGFLGGYGGCSGVWAASEAPEAPSPEMLGEDLPSVLGKLEDLSFDPPVIWVIMDENDVMRIPWTVGKTLFLDFNENGEKKTPKKFFKKHHHHYVEVVLTREGGSAVSVEHVPD